MCGIVGWVSYDRDFKADEAVIMSKMTETMARRGPDAGGVWIDRHVGLGHRRLAVIDLIGGAQPMQAEETGAADRLPYLYRRGLQLCRAVRRANAARPPIQDPQRHGSRAPRIPSVG